MSKSVFRFEAPPLFQKASADASLTLDVIRRLKEHPGEWAVIREPETAVAAYALAHQIRTGRSVNFRPAGSFEARGCNIDGNPRVYARYVGEGSEGA